MQKNKTHHVHSINRLKAKSLEGVKTSKHWSIFASLSYPLPPSVASQRLQGILSAILILEKWRNRIDSRHPRDLRGNCVLTLLNRDALLSCAPSLAVAGSIDIISGLHETRTESTMRFRVCIGPPRQAAHSNAKSVCARLRNASEIVHSIPSSHPLFSGGWIIIRDGISGFRISLFIDRYGETRDAYK